ncbi:tRNA uridine-5-carboxymethylaminomethyl(34) synthesis GTPase MnmE [Candidatus Omnitrophota bacterium]
MKDNIVFGLADTIASIATMPGQAAVGVIKISGSRSLAIAARIFRAKRKKDLKKVRTYTLHYGWIVTSCKPHAASRTLKVKSGRSNDGVVDEVLLAVMRGPFSYTREDVVEIYSHSGQVVLNRILELVLSRGARLAQPGEFTRRAFLSGRIDLTQAEAVRDIVEARTERSLKLGVAQLKGRLSGDIGRIEKSLKELCVRLEAQISFPDQIRLDKTSLKKAVKRIAEEIAALLANSQEGRFLREGVSCVICGRANVGKSSLLNMFLKEERVIVTPLAGTTRDVVEDSINIRGLPLKIYDTAGILEPKDLIAAKAMEKSYAKIDEADLILLVFDRSKPLNKDDTFLIEKVKEKRAIFIINKIDLPDKLDAGRLRKYAKPLVRLSALKNKGLSGLEESIVKAVFTKGLHKPGDIFLSNIRHIGLLKAALKDVDQAGEYLAGRHSLDLVFFALGQGLEAIARITGKTFNEDILDSIFGEFCIGK